MRRRVYVVRDEYGVVSADARPVPGSSAEWVEDVPDPSGVPARDGETMTAKRRRERAATAKAVREYGGGIEASPLTYYRVKLPGGERVLRPGEGIIELPGGGRTKRPGRVPGQLPGGETVELTTGQVKSLMAPMTTAWRRGLLLPVATGPG